MDDPRPLFLDAVKMGTSRVVNLPRLIFLCGGAIPDEPNRRPSQLNRLLARFGLRRPKRPPDVYLSARHYIRDHLQKSHPSVAGRVRMADDIRNWSENGVYNNLVIFERHLAALADVVVIFVESAGSIAELGAFSHVDDLRTKILAFVQNSHYDDKRSYIKLGPLAYLEDLDNQSVNAFPWEFSKRSSTLRVSSIRPDIPSIIENIVNRAERRHAEESFKSDRLDHRLLLTYDLICLMFALTAHEIRNFLLKLGIECEKKEVQQFLFILERLGFIIGQKYSNPYYYVPKEDGRFIRYGRLKPDDEFRRIPLQQQINDYYRTEDPNRIKAINLATKRSTKS